uniref:Uncharacterized protein n=1 Tax=Fagus sylvatica TaxID=28930 RepID=A0A2N9GQI8_FAGSY
MRDTLFSFEVHFGGIFVRIPNLVYEGGDVGFASNYDKDRLSYFEVEDICKSVGASKGCKLYYLIPGGDAISEGPVINGEHLNIYDPDWLDDGLEGPDFIDDIFVKSVNVNESTPVNDYVYVDEHTTPTRPPVNVNADSIMPIAYVGAEDECVEKPVDDELNSVPIVGLDGCHLKGRFGGHILSATARDGNDNIFPVSMAVVEQESLDSWKWFLQLFKEDIGDPEELKLVFISDRQKGLVPAIEKLFPKIEHRFCLRHIYSNFILQFKGLGVEGCFVEFKCGKCHKEGHNSRSCKASITGETAWQRRQRLDREKARRGQSRGQGRDISHPTAASQSDRSQPIQDAARSQPTVKAQWFSSSQPTNYEPRETWSSMPSSSSQPVGRGKGAIYRGSGRVVGVGTTRTGGVGVAGRSAAGVGRVDLRAGASASQPVGSGVARIDSIARRVDVVSGVGRGV